MDVKPAPSPRLRAVSVNDAGHVIGEDHHRAKLTDHDVWMLLELHDAGVGYRRLARMFGVSRYTARDICRGRRRGQTAIGQKRVR